MENKIILILTFASLVSCTEEVIKTNKTEQQNIIVGDKFLFSLNLDTKDPFEKIEIDTITVVGIKDNYIQWQYNSGGKQSCEIKYFKDYIKPFNK